MIVYLNGKKVSKSRKRSFIGWTDYRCPVKDCFTSIINDSPTAKYKVSAHKRKHTMEAMKKPEYKIGDYVEFKTVFKPSGIARGFIHSTNHYSIKKENRKNNIIIVTRSGVPYYTREEKIIRKLPILRDKNGRFRSKVKVTKVDIPEVRFQINDKPSTCSCFNCDKCAEQMRAYYEKTGELKPKTWKDLFEEQRKEAEEEYEKITGKKWGEKTEEKKPSERIHELHEENRTGQPDFTRRCFQAFADYLDEQFEKNK